MIDAVIDRTSGIGTAVSERKVDAARSYGAKGALSGVISVVVFTAVHHVTISNIWPMLGVMMVAGAVCGLCIAWSYGRLSSCYSIGTWSGYNLSYLTVFAGLAAASMLVFEPVTTMAAISTRGGPVGDLIAQALPLTIGFTVVAPALIGAAHGSVRSDYFRVLLTVAVLMLFVGLNVSVLGLVDFSGASIAPAVTFFALVVLLDAVFAVGFAILQQVEVNPPCRGRSLPDSVEWTSESDP